MPTSVRISSLNVTLVAVHRVLSLPRAVRWERIGEVGNVAIRT